MKLIFKPGDRVICIESTKSFFDILNSIGAYNYPISEVTHGDIYTVKDSRKYLGIDTITITDKKSERLVTYFASAFRRVTPELDELDSENQMLVLNLETI